MVQAGSATGRPADTVAGVSRLRLRPLVCTLVAAGLMVPATASASQVSSAGGVLRVKAAPGELNDIEINETPKWAITDLAGLKAGPGCTQTSPTSAACAPGGIEQIRVMLGDRADHVLVFYNFGPPVLIDGGPGDDVIRDAATNASRVTGGDGDDQILLTPGYNIGLPTPSTGPGVVAAGGPGDDSISLNEVAQGANLDGGPGNDTLRNASGTRPASTDVVLTGGSGDDALAGVSSVETFRAGPGDDTIDGGGGADDIGCGPGLDGYVAYGDAARLHSCETPLGVPAL